MKTNIITFILFVIIAGLLISIVAIIWAVYNNIDVDTIVDTFQDGDIITVIEQVETALKDANEVNTNTATTNVAVSSSSNSSISEADKDFFYNQLSDTQKIIYDELEESKEDMKTGTYVIDFEDTFSDILKQDDGTTVLGDDYQAAIDAYTHDDVEIFYIDISKLYLNVETTKKVFSTSYNVFISPTNDGTYYTDAFSSQDEVDQALDQVEAIKNTVLANLSNNDYENIKIIHDYLIDTIEYDSNYESSDPYSLYGALVDKKAVCEGYAEAFKYLANAAGIECELVLGTATNSEGVTENHEWNCVYLEGNWYYIDVTWDDPVVRGNGTLSDEYRYKYFLKGADSFQGDHVEDGQLVEDGKVFSYPEISSTDY